MKRKRLLIITLVVIFILGSFGAYASTHSTHYDKYLFYGGWGYTNGDVVINYNLNTLGTKSYGYRLNLAIDEWESSLAAFEFSENELNHNCSITSDNYLDSGWVGLAYYSRNPKEIFINEWYHINRSNYNYTAYERVIIHEFGHLHGLDHVDCTEEIMSNNANRDIYQTDLGDGDIGGIKDIY